MKQGSVSRWLMEVMGKQKWNIVWLLVLQVLLGLSSVVFALQLRNIVDSAVQGDREVFFLCLGYLVGLVIFQLLCRAWGRQLEERTRAAMENACKGRLFRNLLCKDYADVTAVHSGEWMNRLTSDTAICAGGAVEILPHLAGMTVKMAAALVMILVLEPKFAYILLPGGILLLGLTYAFRRILKRLHRNVQEADGKLRVFLQEHLGSMLVVRAFAAQERTQQGAQEKMEAHRAARMRRIGFSNFCTSGFSAAMHGMYLLGVGFCGYGMLMGTLSYGTFMAILQLIAQVQAPFANLTGFLPRFYAMSASAERLMEAETYADACGNAHDAQRIRQFYETEFAAVALEHAAFSYADAQGREVLQNVSLQLRKGESIALTGHSGCGKSTLLRLLLCLYPLDSGRRLLLTRDGTPVPLTGEWHRLFGYVPQGNHLMSGTIREAVTFGTDGSQCDPKRLQQVLRIACAEEFVHALAEGADTVLGERGQGLSEGQLQRLAIARALYADCPILLFDEATSALDAETERQLLQNLRSMTDKTLLMITHRPAALEICDHVIELHEQGMEVLR